MSTSIYIIKNGSLTFRSIAILVWYDRIWHGICYAIVFDRTSWPKIYWNNKTVLLNILIELECHQLNDTLSNLTHLSDLIQIFTYNDV